MTRPTDSGRVWAICAALASLGIPLALHFIARYWT